METHLNTPPLFVPIPCLDRHIVTAREDDACGGVNGKTSDIVGVCLKCRNLFMGVVVEDTKLEVVGAGDEPVLAGDEADATDGDLSDLKGLDHRASFMVVDVDRAVVKTSEDPRFGGVEVDAFYAI